MHARIKSAVEKFTCGSRQHTRFSFPCSLGILNSEGFKVESNIRRYGKSTWVVALILSVASTHKPLEARLFEREVE